MKKILTSYKLLGVNQCLGVTLKNWLGDIFDMLKCESYVSLSSSWWNNYVDDYQLLQHKF